MFAPKTRYVSQKGVRKPRPEPFTRDEMRAILGQYPTNTPNGIRNKTLIIFLYRAAARIGCTLRMMPGDIDWTHSCIRIYHDKGCKTRSITLDNRTMDYMRLWADNRESLDIGDDKPFFCAYVGDAKGKAMTEDSVLHKFRTKCRLAGITRRVTLHLLRHTGASELLEEGFDIPTISRVLGHACVATTFAYLHNLRPDLTNARLAGREW